MAVTVTGIVPVFEPLLQLTPPTYLHGSQLRSHRSQRIDKEAFLSHRRGGVDGVIEKVVDHLVVHRRTGHYDKGALAVDRGGIFGRIGGRDHKPLVFGLAHQKVDVKFAGASHQGIDRPQICRISREEEAVPQMLAEPRIASGPHAITGAVDRTGRSPNVGIVMQCPATTTVHGRRLPPLHRYALHQIEKRLVHLGKVGHLGRPVIHLDIDVGGIFSVPGGTQLVVPYSLQVGGLSAGLRAAYQEITAKLEIERGQLGVEILFKLPHPHVGRFGRLRVLSQVERNAVEIFSVRSRVVRYRLVVFSTGIFEI